MTDSPKYRIARTLREFPYSGMVNQGKLSALTDGYAKSTDEEFMSALAETLAELRTIVARYSEKNAIRERELDRLTAQRDAIRKYLGTAKDDE